MRERPVSRNNPRSTTTTPCSQRLNDRQVMGEDDPTRVELLKSLDPRAEQGESLADSLPLHFGCAQLGGVSARGVIRLAGQDDAAVTAADHERLVSYRMPGRWHDPDP